MYPITLIATFVAIASAVAPTIQAATVEWYTDRSCGSASLVYRDVRCNSCNDPAGDWFGAQISSIGPNQRVSYHNQNGCTPGSVVGQWYGPGCRVAGRTALRSVWIACDGQRVAGNATEGDATGKSDAVEVASD